MSLLDLVLPSPCAGCGDPGASWCPACRSAFGAPVRVPLPAAPPTWALASYAGQARSTLLAYKERGRRDLAPELGGVVAAALPRLRLAVPPGGLRVVPAPSRPAAARHRGGDHVLRLARHLVAALAAAGIPAAVAPALRLASGAAESVGLDAAARAANLAAHLRTRPTGLPPPGSPAVLLDDVVTTGATVRACSAELARAGVTVLAALVLASAARAAGRPDEAP